MGSEKKRKSGAKKKRKKIDQPCIPSSLERFVYALERADEGVTGHVGLLLGIEAFHALGLAEACRRELRLKERRRGPTEGEWVEVFVMMMLAGGTNLEDIEVLKQDDGLCRVWDIPRRVSARSALDFLLRFHDPSLEMSSPGQAVIPPETPGLEGLGRVNAHLLAEVQRRRRVEVATLDFDASIHPCDKKEALPAYEHGRAYQPVVGYWQEQRLIVHDEFRDGNVPAGMGNLPFVQAALGKLPEGISKVRVRADSALYDHRLLRYLDREGHEFAISADMSRELRAAIVALPQSAWARLAPRDGSYAKEEKWWAEVSFVPGDLVARKGERPFRYLVIRLPERPVQLDLFEAPPETRYVAIVTNRDLPGPELIHWQREKCGTIEQVHDRLKHDVGARLFPSSRFGANAAWYRLSTLTFNLYEALKLLALPKEWANDRLPSSRFRLINRAGRVLRHARRYIVVLSQVALPLVATLIEARGILHSILESG